MQEPYKQSRPLLFPPVCSDEESDQSVRCPVALPSHCRFRKPDHTDSCRQKIKIIDKNSFPGPGSPSFLLSPVAQVSGDSWGRPGDDPGLPLPLTWPSNRSFCVSWHDVGMFLQRLSFAEERECFGDQEKHRFLLPSFWLQPSCQDAAATPSWRPKAFP